MLGRETIMLVFGLTLLLLYVSQCYSLLPSKSLYQGRLSDKKGGNNKCEYKSEIFTNYWHIKCLIKNAWHFLLKITVI